MKKMVRMSIRECMKYHDWLLVEFNIPKMYIAREESVSRISYFFLCLFSRKFREIPIKHYNEFKNGRNA